MAAPRPASGHRRWWALGIAFTVAFLVFASWRVLSVADEKVHAKAVAWEALDERTLNLTFTVNKSPDATVVCTLQAQDFKKNVVGTLRTTVGPSPERTTSQTATIRTTTLAFAGIVHDCIRVDAAP